MVSGNLELTSIYYQGLPESVSLLMLHLTLEILPAIMPVPQLAKFKRKPLHHRTPRLESGLVPANYDPLSESGNFAPIIKRIKVSRPREKKLGPFILQTQYLVADC